MWKFGKPWLHFASPVFGPGDRVAEPPGGGSTDDGMPPELKGKTPREIAQFFIDRENRLRAELAASPPAPAPTPAQPPVPSQADFWNNPVSTTDARIEAKAMTKAEFERVSAAARPGLIWAAKGMVKEKHPDFHRVEKKVDEIMAKIPEWQHTDPNMWETVYIQAKGYEFERLSAEDRARPPIMAAEPGAPGSTPAPAEVNLYNVTMPGVSGGGRFGSPKSAGSVADNLGVSHDSYKKSQKILDGDGMLPLTVDNRGTR